MRQLAFAALMAILLAPLFCGAVTMLVPAVDDSEQGILTAITMNITVGSGETSLVTHSSTVSEDTQQSLQTALSEAARLAGRNYDSYDYYVRFDDALGKINGPSAGVALTLMAYSEYTGKKLRSDMIVTGAISKGGAVSPVGGIKSKIDAAGNDSQVKLMLIPGSQTQESGDTVLDSVFYADYAEQKYGIKVVPISNDSYAVQIATGAIEPPNSTSAPSFVPIEYPAIKASAPFKQVASDTISEAEAKGPSSQLDPLQKKALDRLVAESKMQLSLGYYYTAANSAFLVNNAAETNSLKNMSVQAFG
ncbi:MAG: hypothetical protein PHT59_07885, partial [Candidatus Omnitrophica bacterium]|nr:hypothetical protein [Candidatus Omnitrophota bacterium]